MLPCFKIDFELGFQYGIFHYLINISMVINDSMM